MSDPTDKNQAGAWRIETDSMGEVQVPADACWGAQTQRAVNNFPHYAPMPVAFIHAVARIKACAAAVNLDLGLLDAATADAIVSAATRIIDGDLDHQFPVDRLQTGSGTSTNMNVNEVISHLAADAGVTVHPNDHVNLGQSSNDTIPTAVLLSSVTAMSDSLLPAMAAMDEALSARMKELDTVVKPGRTHLMDAMPVTFGQVLAGWREQLRFATATLCQARDACLEIPQGGTAVGTGINTHEDFAPRFARALGAATGFTFTPLASAFAGQGALDRPTALSAALRGLALVVAKIAEDLRWMASGPHHGLAEIRLPKLQPGSSIMPGKVNPVICESVLMACTQIQGLDHSIAAASQSSRFELNVMQPLVACNLLDMIELAAIAVTALTDKVLLCFEVNRQAIEANLMANPVLVTALNPLVGYSLAAKIAQKASETGQPVIDVAEQMTDISRAELERILDPLTLTRGGL
ncbi:MAG: class II fumarate hydratase [Alcanivoracaceae bacterium]|nr:class II fumarate hydratase [Alcanivoracaceae bacterium]